jgi:hypothetical protein
MAIVTFTLKDFRLESLAGRQPQVFFIPSDPATSSGYVLSATPVGPVPLTASGSGEVNLVPTTVMLQKDIYYRIRIKLLGAIEGDSTWIDFPDWKLYVPLAGGPLDELISAPLNPIYWWVGPNEPPGDVPVNTFWWNTTTNDVKRWR